MKQEAGVTAKTGGSTEPKGDHIAGRKFMLRALRDELVGPSPKGPEIDLDEVAKGAFPSEFKGDGPYVQQGSKEEILCTEPPGLRYGIGILYPRGATKELDGTDDSPADRDIETTQTLLAATESKTTQEPLTREGERSVKRLIDRAGSGQEVDGGQEFDLSGSNMRRPNSMAVSFLAQPPGGAQMVVSAGGGRYEPVEFVESSGRRRVWWAPADGDTEGAVRRVAIAGSNRAGVTTHRLRESRVRAAEHPRGGVLAANRTDRSTTHHGLFDQSDDRRRWEQPTQPLPSVIRRRLRAGRCVRVRIPIPSG